MASTAALNYISLNQLLSCGYSMIGIVSGFAITRIAVRITRPKAISIEDVLVLVSYLTFLVSTVLYIHIAPTIFKVSDYVQGKIPPYAKLEQDAMLMIRVFFANTLLFWCTLWLVKGSFLSLYWKVLRPNRTYRMFWYATVVICLITFVGNVVSHLTSCSSMHAWFTVGGCATHRDSVAQITSLYMSFAFDVFTDLLIMALPIGVIWGLKLPTLKKAGIIALFAVGWIAITAAIIRVVSLGVRAGVSTPSSSWLAFWGTIETGIAVIIGTAPGLYSTARQVHASRKESKYAGYHDGYQRHTGDVSVNTPGSGLKEPTANVYSLTTADIDDDEQSMIQPHTLHNKTASFSRPIYLKPLSQNGNSDVKMSPRGEDASQQIMVTRQFAVRKEW